MPNIAETLKAEIARVARRELRPEITALRKTSGEQRGDVAALKKRVRELEAQLKLLVRHVERSVTAAAPRAVATADVDANGLRFRAAGMASNRARLGLSARDFGLLVDASAQSVRAWEEGRSKPQGKQLAAIAALRGVGKRDVEERLAALR